MNSEEITPDENVFIEQIKIGLEILIKRSLFEGIKTPKRYSALRSHHKKKSLAHTSLIHEIIKKSEQKEDNLSFRPAHMRLKLPEDLRNIQYSDLSDLMYSLNKCSIVNHTSELPKNPGHPFTEADKRIDDDIPGVKSNYTLSTYLRKISMVIEKPKVQKILYQHLLNTGLLMKLYKNGSLIASNIKKRNDIATAKNFIRTTKPSQMTNEKNLEKIFQKDNKKLISMNKAAMEREANNWSKKFVLEHKADEYLRLYLLGGIFYYMAYKNYRESS
jgi:hypothetical protein